MYLSNVTAPAQSATNPFAKQATEQRKISGGGFFQAPSRKAHSNPEDIFTNNQPPLASPGRSGTADMRPEIPARLGTKRPTFFRAQLSAGSINSILSKPKKKGIKKRCKK